MKKLHYIFCAAIFCISVVNTAYAQNKVDKKAAKIAAVAAMVDSKNFVFNADYQSGRALNSSYNLVISMDTVSAYLPYVGESHVSMYGSANGDLNFKWTNCIYKIEHDSEGNKQITITASDFRGTDTNVVQSLVLFIAANGNATLTVNSVNRGKMSFTGPIEKGRMGS